LKWFVKNIFLIFSHLKNHQSFLQDFSNKFVKKEDLLEFFVKNIDEEQKIIIKKTLEENNLQSFADGVNVYEYWIDSLLIWSNLVIVLILFLFLLLVLVLFFLLFCEIFLKPFWKYITSFWKV